MEAGFIGQLRKLDHHRLPQGSAFLRYGAEDGRFATAQPRHLPAAVSLDDQPPLRPLLHRPGILGAVAGHAFPGHLAVVGAQLHADVLAAQLAGGHRRSAAAAERVQDDLGVRGADCPPGQLQREGPRVRMFGVLVRPYIPYIARALAVQGEAGLGDDIDAFGAGMEISGIVVNARVLDPDDFLARRKPGQYLQGRLLQPALNPVPVVVEDGSAGLQQAHHLGEAFPLPGDVLIPRQSVGESHAVAVGAHRADPAAGGGGQVVGRRGDDQVNARVGHLPHQVQAVALMYAVEPMVEEVGHGAPKKPHMRTQPGCVRIC